MKTSAKLVGILLLLWLVYRPIVHALYLPRVVHSAWVENLAKAGNHYSDLNELSTDGEDARKIYDDLDPVFKANDQKRKLYAMYLAGKGEYGLSRRYGSVEGDPIFTWLLVQDGKVTFIKDSSRDGNAPPYAIHSRVPSPFKLGYLNGGRFIEGEPASTNSPILVFQLSVPNILDSRETNEEYFY